MLSDIDTLFLDAGGVIVHPSWARVSQALARHGVSVPPAALSAVEPRATFDIDSATTIQATDDRSRGWLYFDLVLRHAGIEPNAATAAALAELREYHRTENLWEHVEADVVPALRKLRDRGLKLVVVSNANGRLKHLFDRLDLSRWFDHVLDSHEWGVEKPDPKLFLHALEESGSTADRTVHVGDLYHVDVMGARWAGLRGAILVDVAELYGDADCPRVNSIAQLVGEG